MINKPSPVQLYLHYRRAFRDSRRAAYLRTVHRVLPPAAATVRIERMINRTKFSPLLPAAGEDQTQ